ncbi:MAG: hypothetical protein RLZZ502_963 [Pseudomonadota bacterium]|jgi:hypothetical protein
MPDSAVDLGTEIHHAQDKRGMSTHAALCEHTEGLSQEQRSHIEWLTTEIKENAYKNLRQEQTKFLSSEARRKWKPAEWQIREIESTALQVINTQKKYLLAENQRRQEQAALAALASTQAMPQGRQTDTPWRYSIGTAVLLGFIVLLIWLVGGNTAGLFAVTASAIMLGAVIWLVVTGDKDEQAANPRNSSGSIKI